MNQPDPVPPVDPQAQTQVAPTNPAEPTTNPADPSQQNPLDLLEKLLQDAKNKKGSEKTTAGSDDSGMPPLPALDDSVLAASQPPAEPVAVKLTEQDFERIRAEHDVIDQQKIEEQKIIMEQLKQSPQYQARVRQDEDKATESQEKRDDQDGYEIEQLVHTKI